MSQTVTHTITRPRYFQPQRAFDDFYDPMTTQKMTAGDRDVGGSWRFKYFRRPFIPLMTAVPPNIVLAPTQDTPVQLPSPPPRPPTPATKEMCIQTDYRDSEAQTDPYTPDYTLPEGRPVPDILALLPFSWGNGLPATAHEVYLIEKAQARREAEASLPPVTDDASFNKRVQFFAQCELEDWMEREEEIRRLQEQRLGVLSDALNQRDKQQEVALQERLARVYSRLNQKKDQAVETIQRKRSKALRTLSKARTNPSKQHTTRDIVGEYYNYGSKTYAPIPRDGRLPDRSISSLHVRSAYLDTLEGLDDLHASLPRNLLNLPTRMPSRRRDLTIRAREQRKIDDDIRHMERTLRERTMLGSRPRMAGKTPVPQAEKKTKHIPVRPPTPTLPMLEEEEDTRTQQDARLQGILLIQRLLRGRAVQNIMFNGKEKRRDLIKELRLQERIEQMQRDRQAPDAQQSLLENASKQLHDNALHGVLGDLVGQTLDTLAKELVHFREERRVMAMVHLAERTRRLREAEETGRRQQEMERRQREDERFRQVMHVQHRTVDDYLEGILCGAVDAAAKKQAVVEARVRAGKLGDILYEIEDRYSKPQAIVKDLVASFLYPEVERGVVRERVKRDQQRFLSAARQELNQAIGTVAQTLEG